MIAINIDQYRCSISRETGCKGFFIILIMAMLHSLFIVAINLSSSYKNVFTYDLVKWETVQTRCSDLDTRAREFRLKRSKASHRRRDELKFISARVHGDDNPLATLVEINWRFRETILDVHARLHTLFSHVCFMNARVYTYYASLLRFFPLSRSFYFFYRAVENTQMRFGSAILSLHKWYGKYFP